MASASVVWDFFKVSEENILLATCNKCKGEVPRGGKKASSYNTSNLISHLKHRHRYDGVLQAYEDAKVAKAAANPKPAAKETGVNVPIDEAFAKVKKFHRDDPRAQAITNLITEMMALDDQPFSIVEDRGFVRVIHHLEPRYIIPSRRYFSDECLPAKYDEIATLLHTLIDNDAQHISFTTDIWTCDNHPVSMLGLTAQWLDKDFKLYRAVLHSQELPGSHTADCIRSAFVAMLQRWNIKKEMVHVVLRDNAANMAKAMRDHNVESLGCMAHTLQLAVGEAVLAQRAVIDCVAIGRKICGHFKHSQVALTKLQELMSDLKIPLARLQQDASTRWNSTFYMLQSLVKLKKAIAAYGVQYKLPAGATLNANQWDLIENILTILEPCERLTKRISKATATTADVIPSVQALTRMLKETVPTDRGVKTTKETLLKAVETRFGDVEEKPMYYISTILDPRYKDLFFTRASKRQATEMLRDELHKMERDRLAATENPGPQRNEEPPAKRSRDDNNNSLLGAFQAIIAENTEPLRSYLLEPTLQLDRCPLEYWRSNQSRYEQLSQLARKYLSAPCTSVDSERLFSAAGNVMSEKRSRLLCEKAEKLLFIKKNLPLIHPELKQVEVNEEE
ncbi:zinc finger BED domain-containing protein 4-like [Diretmus argenteus]